MLLQSAVAILSVHLSVTHVYCVATATFITNFLFIGLFGPGRQLAHTDGRRYLAFMTLMFDLAVVPLQLVRTIFSYS